MSQSTSAPGQRYIADFPRFGLPRYASRFPDNLSDSSITVTTPNGETFVLTTALLAPFYTEVTADFHCVTTWSHTSLKWSGAQFNKMYAQLIQPNAESAAINTVALYAQDGYKTTLPLNDLLADNVLLANRLNGDPLTIEHGAPVRLVAPLHYGYKNIKHLKRIEFRTSTADIKSGLYKMLDHPRARVAQEERGRFFPGWLLRRLYRPLIRGTRKEFKAALNRYLSDQ